MGRGRGRPQGQVSDRVETLAGLERVRQRADGAGEILERVGDLRRDVLVERQRAHRATGQHADVAHRQVDPARRLGVDLHCSSRAPARGRNPGGVTALAGGVEKAGAELVDAAGTDERGLGCGRIAPSQRFRDVLERRGQLVEDRPRG